MNNIWKILSLVSVLVIIAFFFLFLFQKRSCMKMKYSENKILPEILDSLAFYRSNNDLNMEMKGFRLPNIIGYDRTGKYQISKFQKSGKPLLIYYYTQLECSTCVENILMDLNQHFNKSSESVLVLCSYMNKNEFYAFRRKLKIDYPILLTDWTLFNWKQTVTSCFFVLYPNSVVSDFYLPNMQFPDTNEEYVESVRKLINVY